MADILNIEDFLGKAACGVPVIDVRSPAEYLHAHIPRAVSVPLFDDGERADVGTIYKKRGKIKAVRKGLEIVGSKLGAFADAALKLKSPELLLYCWRGGMRSASMAWLFETLDIKCHTLSGGYKSYRNHVLDFFEKPFDIVVIGGCTGAGKTDILHELRRRGGQVIDLEALACHKGSAFGPIGEAPQPSSEMFEHKVFDVISRFDPARTVYVEDESKNIGKVFVPEGLWRQMKNAPLIIVDTSYNVRLERILKVYSPYPAELLADSILKIEKRIGREKCMRAYNECLAGNMTEAARICLSYYDRLYLSLLEERKKECSVFRNVACDEYDVGVVCDRIMDINDELIKE